MTCPKCGSDNVRSSHHSRWTDWLHRLRSQRAWRCRECRLRFYATGDGDNHSEGRKRRAGKRGSKRLKRMLVQTIIGVILLLLFYVFLRYLTREPSVNSDSGQLATPHFHVETPGSATTGLAGRGKAAPVA